MLDSLVSTTHLLCEVAMCVNLIGSICYLYIGLSDIVPVRETGKDRKGDVKELLKVLTKDGETDEGKIVQQYINFSIFMFTLTLIFLIFIGLCTYTISWNIVQTVGFISAFSWIGAGITIGLVYDLKRMRKQDVKDREESKS